MIDPPLTIVADTLSCGTYVTTVGTPSAATTTAIVNNIASAGKNFMIPPG
jgi:hypothetical protein